MSFQIPFPTCLPSPSKHLLLTLISLEDWALITINGPDNIKYLQSQLTCDMTLLKVDRFSFAAHCNAKGKMFSYLCVFYYQEGIACIGRRSVRNKQIKEFKKYAFNSKISINANDEVILLGITGFQVKKVINKIFNFIPNATNSVINQQDTTLLFFNLPIPRFMLITTKAVLTMLQCQLKDQIQLNDSRQWLALDIEAGYPIIDSANSELFIPQAANVHALEGISFNKGCYTGQEMIARAKYRNANKRALYWLSGQANYLPDISDSLELKIGNNWRRTGSVLAACQLKNNSIWIQAILNKNIAPESLLRVCGDNTSELIICSLPYIIS